MIFFKIDIYVVLILGIIGLVIVFSLGFWYLESWSKKVRKVGEGYYGFNNELVVVVELEKEFVFFIEFKYEFSVVR